MLPPVRPPDFPALFPVGFHELTIETLEQVCVDLFPLSTSRKPIMDGLRQFVGNLAAAGVVGNLWIDGSFLTDKIDPEDVDVILLCDGPLYDRGPSAYQTAVDWVIDNQKATFKCDSYALFQYPPGHALHTDGVWWHAYWLRQWGFSRESDPKGIVVITL
jgi:hypothetical protein